MAYTPIIAISDLSTHIYAPILAEISRDDDTILERAILNGIAEVKIYLSRYDLVQMFGDETTGTSATFSDPYLTGLIKDLISWHVIKLANPNLDRDAIRQSYEDAIATLKMIQAGKADPRWPYLDTTGLTTPPGISVSISSNPKRNNRW